MTLHRQDEGGATWLLSTGERELLLTLFARPSSPRLPSRLSRTSAGLDEELRSDLAGELEDHRGSIRSRLMALLRGVRRISGKPWEPAVSPAEEPRSLDVASAGWLLHLTTDDREALLQGLNELRLGAWEQLGRPDPPEMPASLSPTSPDLLHWWTLEIASRFQSRILSEVFPE